MVLRPDDVFRGYAGQIVSGTVRLGDRDHGLAVGPVGQGQPHRHASTATSTWRSRRCRCTLTLDDEIDISRGDVLTLEPAFVGRGFEAEVVWMDERPLDPGRVYLLKQGTRTVTAEVNHPLVLNQIGTVQVSTARPIVFDRYADNRSTGNFILIDPGTHFTCGAGMITEPVREAGGAHAAPVTFADRLAHIARRAASDRRSRGPGAQGARRDAGLTAGISP